MMESKTQTEALGGVAAILLASGFSKRFGKKNKLLAPFRGKPLARYTLELAAELVFAGGVFYVTASDDVASLTHDLPLITVISNTAPEKGLRESIRLGVEAAGLETEHYLFFHCDQPFLDTAAIKGILDAREKNCIVEPHYRGRPGNPCLFSAVFREELLSLKDSETPKVIKTRHPTAIIRVEVSNSLALEDIDDEETMNHLEQNSAYNY
jgi:molybdenum cofactor cytidylyltransferase